MKAKQFIIDKAEIMIFFNALMETGYNRNLQISIPLLDNITLCKFHIDGRNVQLADFITYEDYSKITKTLVKALKNKGKTTEIPFYNDIQKAFVQAGIAPFDGREKLDRLIEDIHAQNIARGGDAYYIAMDTNLLRDRFYSVYLKNIPFSPKLDYILCETVRDEMKNRDDKVNKNMLKKMLPLNYNLLAECFLNQNCLEDRKRYLGFREYNYMRTATSCEEIDSPSHKTSMANDQSILKAYSDFVDIGRKVVFLSKDNEAVRMMAGEDNVVPIVLEDRMLHSLNFNVKWNLFFDLLYLLGILFGKLDIMVGDVPTGAVYAVWKTKDVHEWEDERILLKIYKPGNNEQEELADYRFTVKKLSQSINILQKLGVTVHGYQFTVNG